MIRPRDQRPEATPATWLDEPTLTLDVIGAALHRRIQLAVERGPIDQNTIIRNR